MVASRRVSGLSWLQQYQLQHRFGTNCMGGETWLGNHASTRQPVLIQAYVLPRHYQKPLLQSYQKHIAKLLELDHPRVPAYLDAETEGTAAGKLTFYTVQSLVQAKPLRHLPQATPTLIRKIAREVLQILVDLQRRSTPVLHGALNPDNLWLSDEHQAYLVNFALDLDLKRPMGRATDFLAPEQHQGRTLGLSTDLYSLGVTLISWAMDFSDEAVHQILNSGNNVDLHSYFPHCFSLELLGWLKTLVQPEVPARFPNAETALAALERTKAERQPTVKLRPAALVFSANQVDERLYQVVTLENSVPDTTLCGQWEIDPDDRPWLRIDPLRFSGNRVKCRVYVDTRHLHSNRTIERILHLKSNAGQIDVPFRLWIKTASFRANHLPWMWLLLLSGLTLLLSQGIAPMIHPFGRWGWCFWSVGAGLGGAIGWAIAQARWSSVFLIGILTTSFGIGLGILARMPQLWSQALSVDLASFLSRDVISVNAVDPSAPTNYLLGTLAGILICGVASCCAQRHRQRGFTGSVSQTIPVLTLLVSFLIGAGYHLGGLSPFLQGGLAWSSGLLSILIVGAELRALMQQGGHLWQQRRRIGAQASGKTAARPVADFRETGDWETSRQTARSTVARAMRVSVNSGNVNASGRPTS